MEKHYACKETGTLREFKKLKVIEIYDEISEYICKLPCEKAISLYNDYCKKVDKLECRIYGMNEFNKIVENYLPLEIMFMCDSGGFYPHDLYFWFNEWGEISSGDHPIKDQKSPVSIGDIAKFIIVNDDDFGNEEIRKLLDE